MINSNNQGEVLYRRPLPVIKDSSQPAKSDFHDDLEDDASPAPPVSREQKRTSLPPLLTTADTPFVEEEIWQWLVTNSDITSSPSVNASRSRTRTKDKRHHSDDLPDQLPPRGAPAFPSRQPLRNRQRQFTDIYEEANVTEQLAKKENQFTLQDFLLKLEENTKIAKPVLEKAVLSKNHYNKLIKLLSERVEEDSKKYDVNRGLAVMDVNEEFDLNLFQRHMKSPGLELGQELTNVLFEHVQQVDSEQKRVDHQKKQQLDEIELPASLMKMKADQHRRNSWRKKQHEQKLNPLSVNGESALKKEPSLGGAKKSTFFAEEFQNPTDSLQFYAQPTHFQDSVRTKEPFALVNREDEVSPTEFAVLESLFSGGRWLSLKAHFISEIPNLMLLRKTLTYVNLSFNCFSEIPTEIYEMENLQILKLRNNPIKEIPQDCCRLKRLRVLVMSFCMVSSISASFWYGMEKLILLDLSFNRLASIPNEVMFLKSLRELNLAGNQLIGMPSGALYLNLKSINIGNNYMHPLLWRENAKNTPQRLQDMAAHQMVKENLVRLYPDLPDAVRQYLSNGFVQCDACKGPRFGLGLTAIRPCEYIFGIRNLPFVFRCCSAECVYIFRRGIADPIELRSDEKDEDIDMQQQSNFMDAGQDPDRREGDDYSPFSPVRRNTTSTTMGGYTAESDSVREYQ